MRGLWLEDKQMSCREDLPAPVPEPDSLLVRVKYAGICGTDIELTRGYYDFRGIPGHEFTGTVVEGPGHWLNKRIVASINIGCGDCQRCRAGMSNHCDSRTVVGIKNHPGAFAELVAVPVANAFVLPDSIDDRQAVLVEPLAAALEILEQVAVDTTTRVLVSGAGRLAQLVIQVLASRTRHLDVLVRTPARISALEPLNVGTLMNREPGAGHYDLVVECTGNPAGFDQALRAVRPRGTLVMKSTYSASLELDASQVVVNEITLLGSRCGPFGKAITWLEEGHIQLSHLTFREFSLEAFGAAFDLASDPSIYKVLLRP